MQRFGTHYRVLQCISADLNTDVLWKVCWSAIQNKWHQIAPKLVMHITTSQKCNSVCKVPGKSCTWKLAYHLVNGLFHLMQREVGCWELWNSVMSKISKIFHILVLAWVELCFTFLLAAGAKKYIGRRTLLIQGKVAKWQALFKSHHLILTVTTPLLLLFCPALCIRRQQLLYGRSLQPSLH